MPYVSKKYGGFANGTKVYHAPTHLISLNFDRVVSIVAATARTVTYHQGHAAEEMARNRAPVRKVFQGGRDTFRKLSKGEILDEMGPYLRSMSAEQRQPMFAKYGTGGRVSTYMNARGENVRVAIGRNRANLWRTTQNDRQVDTYAPGGGFRIGSHGQAIPKDNSPLRLVGRNIEFGLNAEGRYILRNTKFRELDNGDLIAMGRGGLSISANRRAGGGVTSYDITLGGALRKSITSRSESYKGEEGMTRVVVAGGETAPYARFMEFGTRYVAARPFLRPALKHVEQHYAERMRNALHRAFG